MAFDKGSGYAASETDLDIYSELARAYVPPGIAEDQFSVLDDRQCALLHAWTSELIPSSGTWPAAGEIHSVEYIDQNLIKAPRLRPLVFALVAEAEALAQDEYAKEFVAISSDERVAIMTQIEKNRPTGFRLVMELVYEAYYRDRLVLSAVEQRTGFRPRLAVDGFATPRYDDEVMTLLVEVGGRPSIVREVTS